MAVVDLAEQTGADHLQNRQIVAAEAPVLKHHAGRPGRLLGVDEFPTLLDVERGGHFDSCVFASLHGADTHWRVQFPRGGDDYGVYVIPRDELLVVVLARVALWLFPARTDYQILTHRDALFVDIAKRGNLHAA